MLVESVKKSAVDIIDNEDPPEQQQVDFLKMINTWMQLKLLVRIIIMKMSMLIPLMTLMVIIINYLREHECKTIPRNRPIMNKCLIVRM